MAISRRKFIAGAAAGVGAFYLGNTVSSFASVTAPKFFNPYEQVVLGKTGIKVSRLGFGTGVNSTNRVSYLNRQDHAKAMALLRGAFEKGVTFFDSADSYGTHGLVAEAFSGVPRDKYVLGTKYWFAAGGIPEADKAPVIPSVERFLRELKTDYIDIIQLHCSMSKNWNTELSDVMTDLDKLKQQGKIRAHGISNHNFGSLETTASESWVDSVHVRINPYDKFMDADHEKVMALVEKMSKQGKGLIAMKVFAVGELNAEQRLKSMDYVVNSGCFHTLDIGFQELEQIDDVAAMGKKILLK